MPWQIILDEAQHVIETRYVGRISEAELGTAIDGTLVAAKGMGTNLLLGDCTTLEGGHGMGDLYFFARKVAALGFSALCEAVLVPKLPEAGANVSFWEVTAKNHGLTVQLFDDRQAAMAWLVGGGA